MEAAAKFTFRATAEDELSFEKGSIVKVKPHNVLYEGCSMLLYRVSSQVRSLLTSILLTHCRF